MKRRSAAILTVCVILAIALSLFLALHFTAGSTGSVALSSITFRDEGGRECNREYDITRLIVRAERNGRGTEDEIKSLPYEINELEEGIWTIMVDAFDSSGSYITSCRMNVNVKGKTITDLDMDMSLPRPTVEVPNGKLLRVEEMTEFSLSALYRPMKTGEKYTYIWTFWPEDAENGFAHSVDMFQSNSFSSDAFWQIYDFYEGSSREFGYTVDVTGAEGKASFSGHITVV